VRRRIKFTDEELRNKIMEADESLESGHIETLQQCEPTSDDIKALRAWKGDKSKLREAEKFCFTVSFCGIYCVSL